MSPFFKWTKHIFSKTSVVKWPWVSDLFIFSTLAANCTFIWRFTSQIKHIKTQVFDNNSLLTCLRTIVLENWEKKKKKKSKLHSSGGIYPTFIWKRKSFKKLYYLCRKNYKLSYWENKILTTFKSGFTKMNVYHFFNIINCSIKAVLI